MHRYTTIKTEVLEDLIQEAFNSLPCDDPEDGFAEQLDATSEELWSGIAKHAVQDDDEPRDFGEALSHVEDKDLLVLDIPVCDVCDATFLELFEEYRVQPDEPCYEANHLTMLVVKRSVISTPVSRLRNAGEELDGPDTAKL
jgi:hypothetical protein